VNRAVDLNALDEAFQFGGALAANFLDALDRLLLRSKKLILSNRACPDGGVSPGLRQFDTISHPSIS
jgi:hypothetical protein